MEIFKFTNPTHPLKMERGHIVNGIKSKLWIERYREAGEFTIVASVESGVKDILTIGSFISHPNTTEIMIVENHEIKDDKGKASDVSITGRSFETILDNRIVGSNKTFPVSSEVVDYNLGTGYAYNQALMILNDHILASNLLNDDNAFPYVTPIVSVPATGTSTLRSIKRGSVYTRVLELLEIDNIGIKAIRPGPWMTSAPAGNSVIMLHKGVDRSQTLMVSHDAGEIDSADYLWSNKKLKNAALITGKWVETVVLPTAKEYSRRMMFVTASDIDEDQPSAPTGPALSMIVAAMQQRGREAIAAQNNVTLVKADVTESASKLVFRKDYDLGDLVTVSGDYNQASKMRVSEFVEIEDETGGHEYPTLTLEESSGNGGGVSP